MPLPLSRHAIASRRVVAKASSCCLLVLDSVIVALSRGGSGTINCRSISTPYIRWFFEIKLYVRALLAPGRPIRELVSDGSVAVRY
jgi:hypothetical protein